MIRTYEAPTTTLRETQVSLLLSTSRYVVETDTDDSLYLDDGGEVLDGGRAKDNDISWDDFWEED